MYANGSLSNAVYLKSNDRKREFATCPVYLAYMGEGETTASFLEFNTNVYKLIKFHLGARSFI